MSLLLDCASAVIEKQGDTGGGAPWRAGALIARYAWVVGPIALAVLTALWSGRRATRAADERERESERALAVANATWASGDEASLRRMFRTELDRIPESDGAARARVFIRFGILDDNPDGQAALFNQACTADPNVCGIDALKQAAEREVRARFVPPGNHLPLYFGGHPPIAGHR